MTSKSAKFKLEKSTKNTHKYEEVEVSLTPKIIGTIYVQKSTVPTPPPEFITVTVEFAENGT